MKVFLIILFVILMIASLAIAIGLGVLFTHKLEETNHKKYRMKRLISIITGVITFVASLFLMIIIPFQMYNISSGELAVVKRFGEVVRVEQPGLRMKNAFSETYEIYSIQIQELEVEKEAYSKDLQAVEVRQIIQFRINPEKVIDICVTYGSLDVLKTRIAAISYEAIEESAKAFDAKELVTKRGEFNQAIKDNIGPKYNSYFIEIHQTILSDIMFTDEFEALIQQSKLVEQEIEREKQEWEKKLQAAEYQVKIAAEEAKERIAKAEGDANAAAAIAEGEARALKELADAQAYEIEKLAEAQAEALRIKLSELESADPTSIAYLQYIAWLEAWDGKLPETILGDNIDILFLAP